MKNPAADFFKVQPLKKLAPNRQPALKNKKKTATSHQITHLESANFERHMMRVKCLFVLKGKSGAISDFSPNQGS